MPTCLLVYLSTCLPASPFRFLNNLIHNPSSPFQGTGNVSVFISMMQGEEEGGEWRHFCQQTRRNDSKRKNDNTFCNVAS